MSVHITDDAEGKKVVRDGKEVGIVTEVRAGTAYVEPDPGLTDKLFAKLGWGDRDDDTYPLQESAIETVTDDEIRLKSGL
ncbi:PRC-barrel domain containing protein [Haloarchaeobius sp. DFWS5]|uniref:PRC-barrel domain containing protein n=1 Tax=Haloarchaeobius sp. DFWS5 TaxID=3446114 RepID=UPI003EBC6EA8